MLKEMRYDVSRTCFSRLTSRLCLLSSVSAAGRLVRERMMDSYNGRARRLRRSKDGLPDWPSVAKAKEKREKAKEDRKKDADGDGDSDAEMDKGLGAGNNENGAPANEGEPAAAAPSPKPKAKPRARKNSKVFVTV
ncbi:MAG: hypothetical protein ACYCOU_20640 [Sulfobacillus sp.]